MGTVTQGWIRQELAAFLWRAARDPRHEVELAFVNDRPIPSARNRLVRDHLLPGGWDFLLSVDSDVWPGGNLLDLAEDNLDVVYFPTPAWRSGSHPPVVAAITLPGEGAGMVDVSGGGLIPISSGGSAFMAARRVFEQVSPPWFADDFDALGILTGTEDRHFCGKAREAGFQVWAALGYPCGHFKEVNVAEAWAAICKGWNPGTGEGQS